MRQSSTRWIVGAGLAALVLTQACSAAGPALVRLSGTDFQGGAQARFGSSQHGQSDVNYVYAKSTGQHASMQARFTLTAAPYDGVQLHLLAMDDDAPAACLIEIVLNDKTIHSGPSGLANAKWTWRKLPIPAGTLKQGVNVLVIRNRAPKGELGMPPWFMVARCLVGSGDLDVKAPPSIVSEFRVTLPKAKRPLPEPLPAGKKPSFRWRGTKGWMWTPKQYLAEIPVLAEYKMNFLMNCYGSMCDIEHHPWGSPDCNRWWEPLPESKRQAYERVVRRCKDHGIAFCFSMNPNLLARRILRYDKPEDIDTLWQHYRWMQGLGVTWFSICLDDIRTGIDAKGQAKVVNAIFERLRANDPNAQMVFCPTAYWGTGTSRRDKAYLSTLADEMHKDVFVFWTGPRVVTPTISKAEAEQYKQVVGHRLFIWDNYPVNDDHPTMHLGPVTGRDPDLADVIDGYMANPLCKQNEINRLPLLTMADFMWNADAYDPARSIGQAILHLGQTPEQHRTLADLVEIYPGMLLFKKGPAFNPLITRFAEITGRPHNHWLAEVMLRHAGDVHGRMKEAFPDRFAPARKMLEADVAKMRARYEQTYGE